MKKKLLIIFGLLGLLTLSLYGMEERPQRDQAPKFVIDLITPPASPPGQLSSIDQNKLAREGVPLALETICGCKNIFINELSDFHKHIIKSHSVIIDYKKKYICWAKDKQTNEECGVLFCYPDHLTNHLALYHRIFQVCSCNKIWDNEFYNEHIKIAHKAIKPVSTIQPTYVSRTIPTPVVQPVAQPTKEISLEATSEYCQPSYITKTIETNKSILYTKDIPLLAFLQIAYQIVSGYMKILNTDPHNYEVVAALFDAYYVIVDNIYVHHMPEEAEKVIENIYQDEITKTYNAYPCAQETLEALYVLKNNYIMNYGSTGYSSFNPTLLPEDPALEQALRALNCDQSQ